jgi:hypothetical protein
MVCVSDSAWVISGVWGRQFSPTERRSYVGEPLRRLAEILPTVILTELGVVISVEAGIQIVMLDSRLRGNDGLWVPW